MENMYTQVKQDEEKKAVSEEGYVTLQVAEPSSEKPSDKRPSCPHLVQKYRFQLQSQLKKRQKSIKMSCWVIAALLYTVYFGFAMSHDFGSTDSFRLVAFTCLLVFCMCSLWIWPHVKQRFAKSIERLTKIAEKIGTKANWVTLLLVYVSVSLFYTVDVLYITGNLYNLVSLTGLLTLLTLCFFLSTNPAMVSWQPVIWGVALQFVFALVILRWSAGLMIFQSLGNLVADFLSHSNVGAEMVFGESYADHYIVFVVLPVIVFFSAVISVLYHLGCMQALIANLGWFLQSVMGTTAAESICAAGNIFVSMTESPLLIRPLLDHMTRSELHAVMTSGFATIAGSVMAAYILFGVPANHLISASVMSAPAALAVAKLFYPETETTRSTAQQIGNMSHRKAHNLIEAISTGASQSIKLVAQIAVNILAFVSLLHLLNAVLTWFGERVNINDPPLTFELISSYVFYPLAVLVGASLEDCYIVGELIGVKIFINEFVAYDRLGTFISNKRFFLEHLALNGSYEYQNGDIVLLNATHVDTALYNGTVLHRGILSDRSELISTFVLCGFSNFAAMGIALGSLGAMAPGRRGDLASVVCRAMIAGNVACCMTACVAGMFYQGS